MKKFNLSLVAVLAMSTFAVAGGDIAPVEPMVEVPVEVPMVEESTGGLYLGAAYSVMSLDLDRTNYGVNNNWDVELDYDAIMLQAGYKINNFVAVEARYWGALGDGDVTLSNDHGLSIEDENRLDTNDITAWGIYVKPMYPVTEAVDVYGLLGYANTDSDFGDDAWDDGTFSWGIGAAFSFSENASVFVDYVSLYNDDSSDAFGDLEVTADTINFGVNYQF